MDNKKNIISKKIQNKLKRQIQRENFFLFREVNKNNWSKNRLPTPTELNNEEMRLSDNV